MENPDMCLEGMVSARPLLSNLCSILGRLQITPKILPVTGGFEEGMLLG